MWKVKDTERITYDILSAVKHAGVFDKAHSEGDLRFSPLEYVKDRYDFLVLQAYFSGKLKIGGNMGLAMKLKELQLKFMIKKIKIKPEMLF